MTKKYIAEYDKQLDVLKVCIGGRCKTTAVGLVLKNMDNQGLLLQEERISNALDVLIDLLVKKQ